MLNNTFLYKTYTTYHFFVYICRTNALRGNQW